MNPPKIPENAPGEIIKARLRFAGKDGQLEKHDQQFKEAKKKHRNILSSFDYRYAVITHPFFISVVFIALGVIFTASRYIKN